MWFSVVQILCHVPIFRYTLDADPIAERKRNYIAKPKVPKIEGATLTAIDDIVRRLCRLCWIVDKPEVTGKLVQLAIQLEGEGIGKLPENMYLNQVPHNRYVRRYFYDGAAQATLEACILCSQGQISNRMQITAMFPEMNPSMDSYRYVEHIFWLWCLWYSVRCHVFQILISKLKSPLSPT